MRMRNQSIAQLHARARALLSSTSTGTACQLLELDLNALQLLEHELDLHSFSCHLELVHTA